MWVRTAGGGESELLNLDLVINISIEVGDRWYLMATCTDDDERERVLCAFGSTDDADAAKARATLDRLQKWIAQGGPDYSRFGHVFDLRTLSEDDEF